MLTMLVKLSVRNKKNTIAIGYIVEIFECVN